MNIASKYLLFFIVSYVFFVGWDYFNNDNFYWLSNIFQAAIFLFVYGLFTWGFRKNKTKEKL